MFRLDDDKLLACFSIGDRDLALAFAEMEGFAILSWDRKPCVVKGVDFGGVHGADHDNGAPRQIAPGVYAYRLRRYVRWRDEAMARHVLTSPGQPTATYARIAGMEVREAAGFLLRLRKRGRLASRSVRGQLIWEAAGI